MARIPRVILLIESSRAFGRDLLRGIANYTKRHGAWTFYHAAPFFIESNREQRIHDLSKLKQWGATGIIMREMDNMEKLLDMGLPTILSRIQSPPVPGTIDITVADTDAGWMAAEHLINSGFRHFAYCGWDQFHWSREREKGFIQRIKQAGYTVHRFQPPTLGLQYRRETMQSHLITWLWSLPKPVGLMTCVDEQSQYVLEACRMAELHVPEDVAIIGCDNDDLICDLAHPTLSSVALSGEQAGYAAAELLHRLMTGKPARKKKLMIYPTYVEVRQSTDVLAMKDPAMVEALRFIRNNADRPIQVTDVVNATSISYRALHNKFQISLERSIDAEIRRTRAEFIGRRILDTSQSISEIALDLDFTDVEHISRFFKRETGMSPLEYRKRYRSADGGQ
jgi:LacI family transcriptional regulator